MVPEECERRIEAACKAFYAPTNPEEWIAPPVLRRNMTNALDAAHEAVPMFTEAETRFLGKRAKRLEEALEAIRDYKEYFDGPPPDDEMQRIAREALGRSPS